MSGHMLSKLLHDSVLHNNHEQLSVIFGAVKEQWNSTLPLLLVPCNDASDTAAHLAAEKGHWQVLECMLDSLEKSEEKLQLLIKPQAFGGETVLQTAVISNCKQAVDVIIKHLSSDQLQQIMSVKDTLGLTLFHQAAMMDNPVIAVRKLTASLTHEQTVKLLGIRGMDGRTAKEYAGRSNSELAELLGNLRTNALIEITKSAKDCTAKQKALDDLTENEDLSSDHIRDLSPYSRQYIIPNVQRETNMATQYMMYGLGLTKVMPKALVAVTQYAFVFYNSQEREDAHDEANLLQEMYTKMGFIVKRQEWKSVLEFPGTLCDELDKIVNKCSVVAVCVMGHGSPGMVTGEGGSQLPINDILHICTQRLPPHIPLIMIIQSCQSFDMTAPGKNLDAIKGNPPMTKHIELVRPHTLLVLATVLGGFAHRRILADALAIEFDKADGKSDIQLLITNAFGRMGKQTPEQTPEKRSTLTKALYLKRQRALMY